MKYYANVQDFRDLFRLMRDELYNTPAIARGEWQSIHDPNVPKVREMLHVAFEYQMPRRADDAAFLTGARMPWAEDHFQERVSGLPLNPAPSEAWWPFASKKEGDTNRDHKSEGEKFSHTYPERMWPKHAEMPPPEVGSGFLPTQHGIRFDYGDLQDVVNQLAATPMTRQAYLPIWFPEDTGVVHGKRVPCTLGYHFIITPSGYLDISYFMRSTDLLRHFQDDVYMAMRLAQWVVERIQQVWDGRDSGSPIAELKVGKLIFHTANMHIFEGDNALIDFWKTQDRLWY